MTKKKLREFWENPAHPRAMIPMKGWLKAASKAAWKNFTDVKATFNSADPVGSKTVFDVGGNKFRIVDVIDYEGQKIFIRAVLDHAEYDKGNWKKDPFGDDWKPYREFKKASQRKNGKRKA